MTRPLPSFALLAALSLAFGAFAGCLAPETSTPALISREHVMTLDPNIAEQLNEYDDDPEGALDLLIDTTLVVRVPDAGDYTLEYIDESGASRTKDLPGMTPGAPQSVTGADALAPVILKKGADVTAVRAGVSGAWWQLGDAPLGFNVTTGARSAYDIRGRVEESLTLRDLALDEMNVAVGSLSFRLDIPMEGTASWEMLPDAGEGPPVDLAGEVRITRDAGDLATLDVTATQEGQPGTAGVISGVNEASARGSARVWVKDARLIAAQFLGGSTSADPRVTVWADGFFADLAEGQSCAGKTRADACEPEEIQAFDESVDAEEKQVFASEDLPRAETDTDREAIALLQRLFSVDIVPGDSAKMILRGDSNDMFNGEVGAPQGDFLVEFSIEATDFEDVTVPAGTFHAVKIIEETRTVLNLRSLDDGAGTTLLNDFAMDETIARLTMWLDAATNEPVKMTSETPVEVDAILKRMLDAVDPSAWDQIGGDPLDRSQWHVTASASSSYELREHRDGTHFSGLLGLALGHMLAGTFSGGPFAVVAGGLGGFASDSTQAMEIYSDRPREMTSLSVVSDGPLADGVKPYRIVAASEGLSWDQIAITLDGEPVYATGGEECLPPASGTYAICRDGIGLGYGEPVLVDDSLTLAAEGGETLRVLDMYTDSVILTLVVG